MFGSPGSVVQRGWFDMPGGKSITDRRIARLQQQPGLECHGDVFGELAGAALDVASVARCRAKPFDMRFRQASLWPSPSSQIW